LIGTRGSRHVAGDDAQHLRCLSAGRGDAAAEPKTFRLQLIDVRWRPKDCGGSWRLYKQKQKWDAGRRRQSFLPLLRVLQTLAKLCQNGSTQHFHHSMYIMSPLTAQIMTLVITTQTAHLQDYIRKCGHQTVKISCLLGSSVPSPVETVGPLPKLHLRRHGTTPTTGIPCSPTSTTLRLLQYILRRCSSAARARVPSNATVRRLHIRHIHTWVVSENVAAFRSKAN
jgi:hypothetical protein